MHHEPRHSLCNINLSRYETQSLEVDFYFPCLSAAQQIRDILAANTRKQSMYFDVSDFAPLQPGKQLADWNGDFDNFSDNEESVASKPFRARSGTDISDMLSSAKHRRKIKRSLQMSGGTKKVSLEMPDGRVKEPLSRFPSLDLEAFTGEEGMVGTKMEDLVGDLEALNVDPLESEVENIDNVR